MKKRKIVIYARYNQKLFVLDFIKLENAMSVISHKKSIYIISNNK